MCVILYNMIVRMRQKGYFEEEVDGADLETELYDIKQAAAQESRSDLENNTWTMTYPAMANGEQ